MYQMLFKFIGKGNTILFHNEIFNEQEKSWVNIVKKEQIVFKKAYF